MRFTAILQLNGKTATGITVPTEVVAGLGGGRRIPVTVGIGTTTYRSTIVYRGDVAMLPVSAEIRTAAGIAAGDEVDVSVEPDDAPRKVEMPDDLAAALAKRPAARDRFATLSYSNQRRHVLALTGARTEATRCRRLERILEELDG
jgi:hypothetical protein